MSVSIHEVLDGLRGAALDERDKGDKFERLVLNLLRTEPEWVSRFSDVWLWSEWPGRAGRPDTGVDLVAKLRDRNGYAAIQCKFYDPSHRVSKGDLDTFLSASGGVEFATRYFFDTADDWNGNATETAQHQAVPVQRVDLAYLDEAKIDWSQYSWSTPEVLVPLGRKKVRVDQEKAVEEVISGLATHDRGKMIRACGTGKTYTSLKIAERMVGAGGRVLFLVPSIQLLSQSLREWMQETEVDIRPFAVCSDVRVGRKATDEGEICTIDLTEPATTDAATLVARMAAGKHATPRMDVVFSTYQSIDVIAEAQRQGLGDFDLIVCDEAHRTTGVTLAEGDESHFVKVHDNDFLRGRKRLYMTATPRVFGEEVRRKAADADAVLADMNDEATFGPELHRLGFGEAVEADLLTDYKVVVLAVDEAYVAENFQHAMATSGEIALGDAAKLLGCWNGLAKHFVDPTESETDPAPMLRAVAFAKDIRASQQAATSFPALVNRAIDGDPAQPEANGRRGPQVEAVHVDGTMGVQERNRHLAWLKADPAPGTCRVLTNARCLSEGVDVPALDAVMFLTPRGSQVDVVQAVGRVMRKAPGKKLGYIILPVVVPSGVPASDALNDNRRYQVVWQVLQALRSHDERFHAMINQIELNKQPPERLIVDDATPRPEVEYADGASPEAREQRSRRESEQLLLQFDLAEFRDAMYARIVKKVGERKYWEKWAADVADIAQAHITRIRGLLANPDSGPAKEFAAFLDGLRGNLNESIKADEAIEMLAQHLITRPIFEALFAGYDFAKHNPVARTMELMLASLDDHNLVAEQQALDRFYASVRRRVEGVRDAEGKQKVIVELYDKFFATAFKKTVDRLGIVYTPIEIVDFILNSTDEVLRCEFGQGLTDEGVHILDGFTGTGTFIVRLLQSGLISPHDLARKYATELHANEILLLAYYIAAVNIETTYAALANGDGDAPGGYDPFPGLVLTDTFQAYEDGDRDDLDIFPANNERIERQRNLPITVIVGNPPYSRGQESDNDLNTNLGYPGIDRAISETYGARAAKPNFNTLHDSYIRAIKWATLRVGDRGLIAFVTNGGFLDGISFDGLRKSLVEEFSTIHVFNLRGNRRNAGAEGRPIFEAYAKGAGGSIAGIAIVVLVKKPKNDTPCQIHYAQVGDFTSATEKLAEVTAAGSILRAGAVLIAPNEHGDWLNQRRDDFAAFLGMGGERGIFHIHSAGVKSNRDAWAYSSSASDALSNMQRLVATYNGLLGQDGADTTPAANDPRMISWDMTLRNRFRRGQRLSVATTDVRVVAYRPFTRQHMVMKPEVLYSVTSMRSTFPTETHSNLAIVLTGKSSHHPFGVLMCDRMPDVHTLDSSQFFARWAWTPVDPGGFDFEGQVGLVDGYRRIDNISDEALDQFAAAYGSDWTKDDLFFYCYGLLHSPEYRETYAANLKKMLPRIPLVAEAAEARAFVDAGRLLSDLHVGYESVKPYPLEGLYPDGAPEGEAAYAYYAVGDKKMRFGKATSEQKAAGEKADRTVIHYNDRIALRGIPEEAYRYQLGSRSAIEWIIDRYYVRTDKASGIVNDPNDWSREIGDPRHILDLLARVVTVSVETMQIVDSLPPLVIRDVQK